MSKVKVSNKRELENLAREIALLVKLAAAADDSGNDEVANRFIIRAEIENGRLVGRRVA